MNQKNNDSTVKKTKTRVTIEPIVAAAVIASKTLLVIKTGRVVRKC